MSTRRPSRRHPMRRRPPLARLLGMLLGFSLVIAGGLSASAASYVTISGSGSSWAGNALAQWVADVETQGVTVNYNPSGSSTGRKEFARGVTQFGVSEIPYKGDTADPQDNIYPESEGLNSYGMLPVVAGGTSFMYNLKIGGNRYTSLNLSQEAVAKIFSGQVTRWNDPVIAADNPGVSLPDQRITVVVRSDGSGATAQFTLWMKRQFPEQYAYLCTTTGQCDGSSATSYFPINNATLPNFVAQSGSSGVTTYTQNTEYTINYDEYSYALQVGFPVANVKNAAGFYTTPTASAVAVSLTQATINTDSSSVNYLSQDLSNVYTYGDPRSYPLSAYSYALVPHQTWSFFQESQGATLAYFLRHALCDGQEPMGDLGYSPLPMNLVLAALDQVEKIPGIDADTQATITSIREGTLAGTSNPCNNPTFQPGDDPSNNLLVQTAPFPAGCDAACQAPWIGTTGSNSGPSYQTTGDGTTNGNGTTGTNGTTPADGTTDSATNAGTEVCDPDTGVCTTTNASTTALGNASAVAAVIPGHLGWTNAQTMMVIAGGLVLAIVLAPPVVARAAGRRR